MKPKNEDIIRGKGRRGGGELLLLSSMRWSHTVQFSAGHVPMGPSSILPLDRAPKGELNGTPRYSSGDCVLRKSSLKFLLST